MHHGICPFGVMPSTQLVLGTSRPDMLAHIQRHLSANERGALVMASCEALLPNFDQHDSVALGLAF